MCAKRASDKLGLGMSQTNWNYEWHVDLIGVLLSGLAISYLGYLGLRDSETGQIRNLKVLAFAVILHSGSYLLSFLLLFKRKQYRKIPSWILMAVLGSVLCAATFRLPISDMYVDGVAIVIVFFSLFALVLMGAVHLVYYFLKSISSQPH
jgi:hypothetical protein